MLSNYRRMAFHPERYQGHHRERRYFEGWYYKLVVPGEQVAYAFIPGISMDEKGKRHAFIQVLDGVAAKSEYHQFTATDFHSPRDRFAVEIGDNYFDANRMRIRLPGLTVDADFIDRKPWPGQPWAPGVMGWYGFVPGMQCYHGLVSLHHQLNGSLSRAGTTHQLSGGIGYIEKDWGSSFPNAWVWMQTNHLDHPDPTSLMISVADIPWLGRSFTGFLSTFLFAGELHTMATWTGARYQLALTDTGVEVTLTDRRRKLVVKGKPAAGGDLLSPIGGGMTGKINESLQAKLSVEFTLDGREVYRGEANWAGLEVTENATTLI